MKTGLCYLLVIAILALLLAVLAPLPIRILPVAAQGPQPAGPNEPEGKGRPTMPFPRDAEAGPTAAGWTIECVDCPTQFADMTHCSLRLDAAGHPHVAYGGDDRLYYAWHDGSTWHDEMADSSPGVGDEASLALDADGYPHISYYDDTNKGLKYAFLGESGTTYRIYLPPVIR